MSTLMMTQIMGQSENDESVGDVVTVVVLKVSYPHQFFAVFRFWDHHRRACVIIAGLSPTRPPKLRIPCTAVNSLSPHPALPQRHSKASALPPV